MEWEGYKAPSDVKTCIQSEGPSDLDNQGLANTPTGVRIGAMQCKDEQEFKNGGERSCATPMTSEAKSCEANINDTNCVSPMPTKIKDQETVAGATQIESVGDLFDADSGIERSSNSGSNSNTEPQNQQTGEDLKQESTLNHATSISEVKATALLTEANQPADQHYEDSPPDAAADNRSSTSTQKSIVGQKRVAASPSSPSSTFSWNDILHVQNLIERCLQQYLTKREILDVLQTQAGVDPGFADVVWQKLEEQNPSFFRAYHIQLRLKEQVVAFNYLIAQQKEMTAKRGKRRHFRTPNPSSILARRPSFITSTAGAKTTTSSSDSSMYSPSRTMTSADEFFAGVGGVSESMSPHSANALVATIPPPSPLPLPSPIKTDLDTHSFFT